jgi:hypothetical protein
MLVRMDDQLIKKYTSMLYGNCSHFYYHRLMFMRVADWSIKIIQKQTEFSMDNYMVINLNSSR